jgi:hypothetical protein
MADILSPVKGSKRSDQRLLIVECIDMLFVTSVGVLVLQAELYIK